MTKYFKSLQTVSAGFMAFSHGANDAQNAIGIITISLVSAGWITSFVVPVWVIIISASAMGLGTAVGGWRVVKTLGMRIFKLQPVHGFAAETSASLVILGATYFGIPISTTHAISGSIMGVGASKRLTAVRWGIARRIVLAWVITLPLCMILSAAISLFLHLFI